MIYAVHRRYTVEDVVFVEAYSPTDARNRADAEDWIDCSTATTVTATTYRKARPRDDLAVTPRGELVKADGRALIR